MTRRDATRYPGLGSLVGGVTLPEEAASITAGTWLVDAHSLGRTTRSEPAQVGKWVGPRDAKRRVTYHQRDPRIARRRIALRVAERSEVRTVCGSAARGDCLPPLLRASCVPIASVSLLLLLLFLLLPLTPFPHPCPLPPSPPSPPSSEAISLRRDDDGSPSVGPREDGDRDGDGDSDGGAAEGCTERREVAA